MFKCVKNTQKACYGDKYTGGWLTKYKKIGEYDVKKLKMGKLDDHNHKNLDKILSGFQLFIDFAVCDLLHLSLFDRHLGV